MWAALICMCRFSQAKGWYIVKGEGRVHPTSWDPMIEGLITTWKRVVHRFMPGILNISLVCTFFILWNQEDFIKVSDQFIRSIWFINSFIWFIRRISSKYLIHQSIWWHFQYKLNLLFCNCGLLTISRNLGEIRGLIHNTSVMYISMVLLFTTINIA